MAGEGEKRDDNRIGVPYVNMVSVDILIRLRNIAAASGYYEYENVHIQP